MPVAKGRIRSIDEHVSKAGVTFSRIWIEGYDKPVAIRLRKDQLKPEIREGAEVSVEVRESKIWYWPKSEFQIITTLEEVAKPKEVEEGLPLTDVQVTLGPDLVKLCDFEETKDAIIIKPKQYLGPEVFKQLADKVTGLGGEYVSAKRGFVIPRVKATPPMAPEVAKPALVENLSYVRVSDIIVPSFLPTRKVSAEVLSDMRESIRQRGIQQPILVRPSHTEKGKYDLVDGNVRLSALSPDTIVPIRIRDRTDEELVIDSIIANKQRAEEDPVTTAKKIEALRDRGMKQEDIGMKLGMSQPTVANYLRLLSLPESVQEYLHVNILGLRAAIRLLQVRDPTIQEKLAKDLAEEEITRKEFEAMIDAYVEEAKPKGSVIEEAICQLFPEEYRDQLEFDFSNPDWVYIKPKPGLPPHGYMETHDIVLASKGSFMAEEETWRIPKVVERDVPETKPVDEGEGTEAVEVSVEPKPEKPKPKPYTFQCDCGRRYLIDWEDHIIEAA